MKEEIEMAYMAAIIDGDGSFSILLKRNPSHPTWKSFYHPCIQLSNCFKGMSEELKNVFGGSLRIKKSQQQHHKELYVWSLRSLEKCKTMIEKIMPYLVLKKLQAKLMLEFIEKSLSRDIDLIDGERFNLKMKSINRDILMGLDTLNTQTLKCTDNPLFWSYLGGLMDTEGSFSIKREKPHSGSRNIRYNPTVQLTMVPSACLNYIRENFSLGNFCIPKAKCTTKGFAFKMSIISKDQCIKFCHKILPYIRYKKAQISTILNFCENYGSVKYCRAGIPQEILEFREECYKQIIALNKGTPS